jgi:lipoyl(octanoyl) transferase
MQCLKEMFKIGILYSMTQQCLVRWLGELPYEQARQIQDEIAADIADGRRPPVLLLLEHPHTYTFGRCGQAKNLLWDQAELTQRGITVNWVDRGGDVTYHGPGQLVGYPILSLTTPSQRSQEGDEEAAGLSVPLPQPDYIGYLRRLEKTLILSLEHLGVTSVQIPGLTGVWVQLPARSNHLRSTPDSHLHPAKIAAIGVKVDVHGITRHGFALNVNPDMSYWKGIAACGLKEYPLTSLAELLDPLPSMEGVIQAVVASFGDVFGYEMATSWQQ